MKQNGKEDNNTPKKGKTNPQMKAALRPESQKCANVMKSTITNKKKKDLKTLNLESATRDTIAETIAFVIKGKLTPIKPLPSVKTTTHIKRLQRERCCKINANKLIKTTSKSHRESSKNGTEKVKEVSSVKPSLPKNVKPKSSKSTAKTITVPTKNNKIGEQPKQFSKPKKKPDIDTSVKRIIRKYAKKLNINNDKQRDISRMKYKENKDNKSEDISKKKTENISNFAKVVEQRRRFRKPSVTIIGSNSIVKPRKKYARLKNENKTVNNTMQSTENTRASTQTSQELETQKTDIELKIKEEKNEEELSLACIKTEPATPKELEKSNEGETIIDVKKEPTSENQQEEKLPVLRTENKISERDDQLNKKKCKSKKLKLLKKKSQVNKTKQKQLEDKRRAKLLQFWNSPKRHRVASLNAIAKVHCLYENESKAVFDKIAENSIIKKEPIVSDLPKKQERKANATISRRISYSSDESEEEQPVKRILRDVPGLRAVGKHWDMHDSISSDNNSDIEMYTISRRPVKVKKESAPKKIEKTEKPKKADSEKQKRKRKPKEEVYMDLKDMVVKKRMASLNASAILAASYSSDKKTKTSKFTDSSSYDTDSSAEEYFAAIEEIDLTKDTKEDKKQEDDRSLIEVHTTPNKKVAVILNQDTDVTITGVYVNSTTRSTHHEGYCSIAGMQYRISATSHTQTAATAVSTEALLQSSGSSDNAHSDAQSCSSKSYTPLDALSSMQPPPGPGIHNAPSSHPGMPCQPIPQMASPQHRQPPPPSTFSPPQHVPSNYAHPPAGKGGPPAPPPPPVDSPGYIHGYYQPAGPLISVSHGHGQLPTQQPPLPKSVPLSDASPTSISSSVHQSQPPPAPGSNNGDSSDNEVIITSVTTGNKDQPSSTSHQPSATYRYPQYSQYHTYPCPPQYHYQIPPPPTQPYQHHEMCYPTAQPSGYVRHTKYAPAPSATYQRYPYYSGHGSELYPSTSAPPAQPSQQIATASQISNGSYPPALTDPPPPPTIMETYPPPSGPPTLVEAYQGTPHYYQSAYGLPPTCYSHSSTRAIPYINATYQHCPCPLNTCPKNGHTGPLTGESKRSNISKDSKPLPPVALALPLEPVSATGPPSPARGSAGMPSGGMPPPPSPAGAHYQPPAVPATKPESRSPEVPECKVEKRKARVGKANVRNNMQSTMLLMCNPTQDYVKREIESPKDKEELHKKLEPQSESTDIVHEKLSVPEACTTTTCSKEKCDLPVSEVTKDLEVIAESVPVQTVELTRGEPVEVAPITEPEKLPPKECSSILPPMEEPLPPCIATVAENVKVKNMKRKQSQSNEKVPESIIPPPTKKKKLSSYKDFIRKHTSCFKINNGKKKLISKTSKSQMARNKFQSSTKKKLGISKEQTNNRRITSSNATSVHSPKKHKKEFSKKKNANKKSDHMKSGPKLLDNLIAKNNIDRVIDDVIHRIGKDAQPKEHHREVDVKKTISKVPKQLKVTNMKTSGNRRKSTSKCKNEIPQAELKLIKKPSTLPKWSNGWKWEGESYEGKVFINSDETTLVRRCYPSMRHKEGDLIKPGDCVLLKAGPRKNDLPYVAKIAALWENPEDGEMMMSLLWYYRPEHTEQGRLLTDQPDEVFASRHKDSNSVACVDDKCYVLTFNEYCRCKKNFKRIEEGLEERPRYVPLPDPYPRIRKQPPTSNISPEMIFFCRKVYDFRQKRIIKNPT